jgi:hypothetical protein
MSAAAVLLVLLLNRWALPPPAPLTLARPRWSVILPEAWRRGRPYG